MITRRRGWLGPTAMAAAVLLAQTGYGSDEVDSCSPRGAGTRYVKPEALAEDGA
ncbi:hypothetical protein ABZ511_17810 [Nocardia gamkensis]|uniref:hypothetical protein n=1 Tax=Nocardia gamkensis TaxID=352869 RepID=UPI0034039AA3